MKIGNMGEGGENWWHKKEKREMLDQCPWLGKKKGCRIQVDEMALDENEREGTVYWLMLESNDCDGEDSFLIVSIFSEKIQNSLANGWLRSWFDSWSSKAHS